MKSMSYTVCSVVMYGVSSFSRHASTWAFVSCHTSCSGFGV